VAITAGHYNDPDQWRTPLTVLEQVILPQRPDGAAPAGQPGRQGRYLSQTPPGEHAGTVSPFTETNPVAAPDRRPVIGTSLRSTTKQAVTFRSMRSAAEEDTVVTGQRRRLAAGRLPVSRGVPPPAMDDAVATKANR
jgi:hypothetical protein